MLTQERLKELLSYNPDNGLFVRIKSVKSKNIGDIAGGRNNHNYIIIGIDGRQYKGHRLAWLYVYGVFPENEIDHINGIKDDNRIENLRDVTGSDNKCNLRIAQNNNSTRLLGVTKANKYGSYQARIQTKGKRITIGMFPTKELAHNAYLEEKRKYHKTCTI